MLEYEDIYYKVEFWRNGELSQLVAKYATEEEAIEYIKKYRHRWEKYSLIRVQLAHTDF